MNEQIYNLHQEGLLKLMKMILEIYQPVYPNAVQLELVKDVMSYVVQLLLHRLKNNTVLLIAMGLRKCELTDKLKVYLIWKLRMQWKLPIL